MNPSTIRAKLFLKISNIIHSDKVHNNKQQCLNL